MGSFITSSLARTATVAAAFIVTGAASVNAAISYDFNSGQADFESKFNRTGGNTLNTNGLSASPGVERTTGGDTFVYYRTPLGQFTTGGDTASISYYFFGSANNSIGTNDFLGFTTNLASGNAAANTVAGVEAQLINNALTGGSTYSNTSLRVETSNGSGTGGRVATADSDTFTLPLSSGPSQWFFQTLSLTYNGSNSFDVATELFNSTNTGTVGTRLDGYTVTRTGLNALVNVPIYGGFQVFSSSGSPIRAGSADNFTATDIAAVPEPTSLAVLGLAGLLGLSRRRAL